MNEETIFAAALEKKSPSERQAFLDEACADNLALRADVEKLLQAYVKGASVFEHPREALGAGTGTDHYHSDSSCRIHVARESLGMQPALKCPHADHADSFEPLEIDQIAGNFRCATGHTYALRPPEPKKEAPALSQLAGFEIIGLLGEGGFGRVWFARADGRFFAVKVLHENLNTVQRNSLMRECEKHRCFIEHPPIVGRIPTLVQSIVSPNGDDAALVYEFINGVSLESHLKKDQRIAQDRAAEICREVALTLQLAHRKNVLHRDVKPGNILIDNDGKIYLTDFGLAGAIREGTQRSGEAALYGLSLTYASPEQIQAAMIQAAMIPAEKVNVDERSDVFSLGVVLFELMTRRLPFEADSEGEVIRRICDPKYPAPKASAFTSGVDSELEAICDKCLQKDVKLRYQSAGKLAEALGEYLNPNSYSSPPKPRAEKVAAKPNEKSPSQQWAEPSFTDESALRTNLIKISTAVASTVVLLLVLAWTAWLLFWPRVHATRREPENQEVTVKWHNIPVDDQSPQFIWLVDKNTAHPQQKIDRRDGATTLNVPLDMTDVWIAPSPPNASADKIISAMEPAPSKSEVHPVAQNSLPKLSVPTNGD